MFCGRITTVNISTVEIDAPTKPNPIKMYIEDFVDDFEPREGDLVGLHYWVMPTGLRGRAAELKLNANDERRYRNSYSKLQSHHDPVVKYKDSSKGGFTDIFELAEKRVKKSSF